MNGQLTTDNGQFRCRRWRLFKLSAKPIPQLSTVNSQLGRAADPIVEYMSRSQLEKSIARTKKLMQEAAKQLNFAEAAQYRDEMFRLEEILKSKNQ